MSQLAMAMIAGGFSHLLKIRPTCTQHANFPLLYDSCGLLCSLAEILHKSLSICLLYHATLPRGAYMVLLVFWDLYLSQEHMSLP